MRKVFFLLLFIPFITKAQHWCPSDSLYQVELKNNPEKRKQVEEFEKAWRNEQVYNAVGRAVARSFGFRSTAQNNEINYNKMYIIPVVFHIIHEKPLKDVNTNEMDKNIKDFLNYVNDVFSGISDHTKGPKNGGVYVPIQFALAQRDIENNPTNGILHIDASGIPEYVEHGLLKAGTKGLREERLNKLSGWNTNYFLNIYVVNKFAGAPNTLAYAYLGGHGTTYTLASEVRIGSQTLPHELGHALNLFHTFHIEGVGVNEQTCPPNNDCLSDNDKVCDTEPIRTLFRLPPQGAKNPCTEKLYDGGPPNFMNYTNMSDRFTRGQVARMIFELENDPVKQSLLKNKMYLPPVKEVPDTQVCVPKSIVNEGNRANMGPAKIKFGELDYNSRGYHADGDKYYIDHAKIKAPIKFIAGNSYPFDVSVETNPQKVYAFIDYNNNGSFEDSERILSAELKATRETPKNLSDLEPDYKVTIPMNAVRNVPLRMRVSADFMYARNYDPKCASHEYGQTEDFAIMIVDPAPDEVTLPKAGINTTMPETALEVKSTNNGVVFPKMNNAEMWSVKSPSTGMLIYNTSEHCLAMNYGTEEQPLWRCLEVRDMN